MFDPLNIRLQKFVQERHWEVYHHPKNLILNTFIELSEFCEHLIGAFNMSFADLKKNEQKKILLKDEMADVLINLIQFSTITKIPLDACSPAKFLKSLSATQVCLRLLVTIGHLATPLTWISEEESRLFTTTKEMPQMLHEALEILLYIMQELSVCPLQTSLEKLDKIELKYPIGLIDAEVTSYYRNKGKNRISYVL